MTDVIEATITWIGEEEEVKSYRVVETVERDEDWRESRAEETVIWDT